MKGKFLLALVVGWVVLGMFPFQSVRAETPSTANIRFSTLAVHDLITSWTIVPDSDVKQIASSGDVVYASVSRDDGTDPVLYSSDKGKTWIRPKNNGLPSDGIIALQVAPDDPKVVVVAIATKVYFSEDSGENFYNIGAPSGLAAYQREIKSLDISPQRREGAREISIGVWSPCPDADSELDENGVFIWGTSSLNWESVGKKGNATSVSFSPNYTSDNSLVAVVSSPKSTYVEILTLQEKGQFPWLYGGGNYNGETNNWTVTVQDLIEICLEKQKSPSAREILSSEIVLPGDFNGRNPEARRVYCFYNTTKKDCFYNGQEERSLTDVYKIDRRDEKAVEKLGMPGAGTSCFSLDSMYLSQQGKLSILAVGASTGQGSRVFLANILPNKDIEDIFWSAGGLLERTRNPQIVFGSSSSVLMMGTSGENSCFSRSQNGGASFKELSLLGIGRGFLSAAVPQDFPTSKTLFLLLGEGSYYSLLKVVVASVDDSPLIPESAERILLFGKGEFGRPLMRIDPTAREVYLLQSSGEKSIIRASFSFGEDWQKREIDVGVKDILPQYLPQGFLYGEYGLFILTNNGTVWGSDNGGRTWEWQAAPTGMSYPRRLQEGPGGTVMIVGGSESEGKDDTIGILSPFYGGLKVMNSPHFN